MRKTATISVILLAVIAGIVALAQQSSDGKGANSDPSAVNAETSPAVVGKPAPDFTLKDTEGREVSLGDFKGEKIVVLEWINYDCPFVKAHYEKGAMQDLAAKYADKGVVWLAVNSTHTAAAEDHARFIQAHSLKVRVLVDPSGRAGRLYGAQTTPHIFIIDKEGMLAYAGGIDNAPLGRLPEGQVYLNFADLALQDLTAGRGATILQTRPYGCSVKYAP
jgi:peroxiredoxin